MARRRHFTLRRLLIGGAALLLGCALGGGIAFGAGSTTAPATATVHLGDNFFQPDHLTVSAGTKVTFTWTGSNTHNVTVVSGPQRFRSVDQASGSYSRVMTKPGRVPHRLHVPPGHEPHAHCPEGQDAARHDDDGRVAAVLLSHPPSTPRQ